MDALLFAPVAVAIALTPGPNNFCGLNNGIRAGVGAALVATVGRVAAFASNQVSNNILFPAFFPKSCLQPELQSY